MHPDESSQKFRTLLAQKSGILGQFRHRAAESDLERNKLEVSEHNLENQLTKINEQKVLQQEEKGKKCCPAAFGQLISGRQDVVNVLKGHGDQHHELNQEIQARIADRQELILTSLALQTDGRACRRCASFSERVLRW